MLHIRRLQGLDSHVHVNKAIGFLNTPKLSFPRCRNLPLWLVWSQLNKSTFPWTTTNWQDGKWQKKLIVDEVSIFPCHAINKHMEVSIYWWDLLYEIMLACVWYGGHYSFTDMMIHILSKTITGIKINKYWKTGIRNKRWAFLPPPPLCLGWIFLLFVWKGHCFLWTDSFRLGLVTVLIWMGRFVLQSSLLC